MSRNTVNNYIDFFRMSQVEPIETGTIHFCDDEDSQLIVIFKITRRNKRNNYFVLKILESRLLYKISQITFVFFAQRKLFKST
jgi:hypothetical protein